MAEPKQFTSQDRMENLPRHIPAQHHLILSERGESLMSWAARRVVQQCAGIALQLCSHKPT